MWLVFSIFLHCITNCFRNTTTTCPCLSKATYHAAYNPGLAIIGDAQRSLAISLSARHSLGQGFRFDEDVKVSFFQLLGDHLKNFWSKTEVSQMVNDELKQELEPKMKFSFTKVVWLNRNNIVFPRNLKAKVQSTLTGSLWLNPFTRMIKPCSPATSLYSNWATSASYAGSARLCARIFTKVSKSTTLHRRIDDGRKQKDHIDNEVITPCTSTGIFACKCKAHPFSMHELHTELHDFMQCNLESGQQKSLPLPPSVSQQDQHLYRRLKQPSPIRIVLINCTNFISNLKHFKCFCKIKKASQKKIQKRLEPLLLGRLLD